MNISSFAVVVALSLTTIAVAEEKRIERKDLPPAVERTVQAQSQGATIRGFSQERENGQTNFEAEMTVNGHSKDVLINPKGEVVEVEEQVPLDSLPPAVKEGLQANPGPQANVGVGRILKVESLTKHGKLVAYEAVVQTGSKKKEIQVDPSGKPLAREE
jgi:hypothetical protein